jgi:hypothetical protein
MRSWPSPRVARHRAACLASPRRGRGGRRHRASACVPGWRPPVPRRCHRFPARSRATAAASALVQPGSRMRPVLRPGGAADSCASASTAPDGSHTTSSSAHGVDGSPAEAGAQPAAGEGRSVDARHRPIEISLRHGSPGLPGRQEGGTVQPPQPISERQRSVTRQHGASAISLTEAPSQPVTGTGVPQDLRRHAGGRLRLACRGGRGRLAGARIGAEPRPSVPARGRVPLRQGVTRSRAIVHKARSRSRGVSFRCPGGS